MRVRTCIFKLVTILRFDYRIGNYSLLAVTAHRKIHVISTVLVCWGASEHRLDRTRVSTERAICQTNANLARICEWVWGNFPSTINRNSRLLRHRVELFDKGKIRVNAKMARVNVNYYRNFSNRREGEEVDSIFRKRAGHRAPARRDAKITPPKGTWKREYDVFTVITSMY